MELEKFGPTKSYLAPQLEARPFPDKGGFGVIAREQIAESTLLAVWTGVVIDEEQLETVPPEIRNYVAQIEETLYLLSVPPIEPADYINHSCQPNAGMSGQIGIVALRDIEPGEEVCIDYAMCDGSPYDEFRCSCGATSPEHSEACKAPFWMREARAEDLRHRLNTERRNDDVDSGLFWESNIIS